MSDMLIEPPTEEDWQRLVQHYNTTRERIAQDVALLKQWFAQQPHLPQTGHGDLLFQTFLIRRKMRVEQAKIALDSYFTVKTLLPEYYSGRDPTLPEIQSLLDLVQFYISPRLTAEGDRVMAIRLVHGDADQLVPKYCARGILMMGDLLHTKYEVIDINSIFIIDCQHVHIGHVSLLSLGDARKFLICHTKGHQFRMKAVHVVNPPQAATIVMTMLKGIVQSKILARVHFHPTLESLHEHVSPEYLPEDYGGTLRSIPDTAALWRKKAESLREWYLEKETVEKVDESKRPGKPLDVNALFGMEGTFRKLTVD